MGEQEKTHKPTHMAQVQGGPLEIKPELILSVVWWESHKLSQMLTCQHHSCGTISMITHTHTHTHKWGQCAALLESASHRAPGQDVSSLEHLVNPICTAILANSRPKRVLQSSRDGILKHGPLWGRGPRQAFYLPWFKVGTVAHVLLHSSFISQSPVEHLI